MRSEKGAGLKSQKGIPDPLINLGKSGTKPAPNPTHSLAR